jgi:hypothetical protein
MQFDEYGHLMPYEIQELTLEEFRYFFVDKLSDIDHRTQLFEQFIRFNNDLKEIFNIPFYQWIDGSFISTKEFPNDIDVVTFMPLDVMNKNLSSIYKFREISLSIYKVDAKFAPVCKWNHRGYLESKKQESYWFELFSTSRKDIFDTRKPKGIIKLNSYDA